MIDLHTHSTFSDGTFTPAELVKSAAGKKIHTLALTDHDTLDGLKEGEKAASEAGIQFIRGVELSINFPKGELHLLGLGLDKNPEELEKVLVTLRRDRQNRNLKIIEKMNDSGYPTTLKDIEKIAGGDVLGRPHLAVHLVNIEACRSIKEAFALYLRRGGAFYIPKKKLDLKPAVDLILGAGGIPVVAHPLSTQLNWIDLEKSVAEWKETGVQGLETVHPSAKRTKMKRLEELAEKYGLVCSGGSDFHGRNRPKIKLGRTVWGSGIPDHYADFLGKLAQNV